MKVTASPAEGRGRLSPGEVTLVKGREINNITIGTSSEQTRNIGSGRYGESR